MNRSPEGRVSHWRPNSAIAAVKQGKWSFRIGVSTAYRQTRDRNDLDETRSFCRRRSARIADRNCVGPDQPKIATPDGSSTSSNSHAAIAKSDSEFDTTDDLLIVTRTNTVSDDGVNAAYLRDFANSLADTKGAPDSDNRSLPVEELALVDSAAATTVLQIFLADKDRRVRSIAEEYYYLTGGE